MGLMKQAYETYCTMEGRLAGTYLEGQEPLVPVSHQMAKADLELTLDETGALLDARQLEKGQNAIIIPVTEGSAGRTGTTVAPHPLCEQLQFLTPAYPEKYQAYLTQLHHWAGSAYGHPKLQAVARYVEQGQILADLSSRGLIELDEKGLPAKEKQLVCWRIVTGQPGEVDACWQDKSLFQAFIRYYPTTKPAGQVFCMVSGTYAPPALQHPKKIINTNANAKLISANDTSGFTYRGRFTEDNQAMTMGYDASQKIHNALRWLLANQGVSIGGRTFLCWSPQGVALPRVQASFLRQVETPLVKPSEYQKALADTLRGWKTSLPPNANAVVAAFDAATPGRLSLTYYSELSAMDFLERLYRWDRLCCWPTFRFGIQSPSLYQIVSCAFGTVRQFGDSTRLDIDDRILRQHFQRLIACRVDGAAMPGDILRGVCNKAGSLQLMDFQLRNTVLFTACAVARKYYFDIYQEEWPMALDKDKQDRSYQYGRLLAVLEKIEQDTFDLSETRTTNALRVQARFSQRPSQTAAWLWEHVRNAYYPKLRPGARAYYDRLIGQIYEMLAQFPDETQDLPLKPPYMMGYYHQRSALYQPRQDNQNPELQEELK